MLQLGAGAELRPRVVRVLARHNNDLLRLEPPLVAAWAAAWQDPALARPLFLVLGCCTRHVRTWAGMHENAEDSASYAAGYRCLLAMWAAFILMLAGQGAPRVARATRARLARLAVDSQLLHALHGLMAATAEAEARYASRLAAAAAASAGGGGGGGGSGGGRSGPEAQMGRASAAAPATQARQPRQRPQPPTGQLLLATAARPLRPLAAPPQQQHQQQPAPVDAAAAEVGRLEALLSDGAVQYLLLLHLLSQVVAADGGNCYGLPLQLLLAAQLDELPEEDAVKLHMRIVLAEEGGLCPRMLATTTPAISGSGGRRQVAVLFHDGGCTGLLTRPQQVPVRALESLLLRLVDVCLASLLSGLTLHLQQQQRRRAGGAGAASGGGAGPAAGPPLYTVAHTRPTATGRVFSGSSSLVLAARAVLLAFSNCCLQAQERWARRRQQQQQQQGTQQQQGHGGGSAAAAEAQAAAAAAAADGSALAEEEGQGDLRALWRPLARIAHACVDVAVATGIDLGSGFSDDWLSGGAGGCSGGGLQGADSSGTLGQARLYNEAVDAVRFVERLMSPCGGLVLPRLPLGRSGLFTMPVATAPPPGLAAALQAGYVPVLERLLRALHRSQGSPRDLADRLMGGYGLFASHCGGFGPAWAALFAYGPPAEVASLVATSAVTMRRLLNTVDLVGNAIVSPDPGIAFKMLGRLKDLALPGEMAMRRRLIRGPNLLQGLLAWLANSAIAAAGTGGAVAAGSGWAAAAAAAGAAAVGGQAESGAGLVPGRLWWQRRWRQQLAAPAAPDSDATRSSSSGGRVGGSGPGGGAAVAGADPASGFDWGVPSPALQALALSSFTLKRWFVCLARGTRNLLIAANWAAMAAAGRSRTPGGAVLPAGRASCELPRDAAARGDDDLAHVGVQTRTALGAAVVVCQAVAVIVHAHVACKEFAEAARKRARSARADSGGGGRGGAGGSSRGGGASGCGEGGNGAADSAAEAAVAAEAEAAAEAWKQLLLDVRQGCIWEFLQVATELIVVGPQPEVRHEHAAWAAHALCHLAAAFPAEAHAGLGNRPVTPPITAATPTRVPGMHMLPSLALRLMLHHLSPVPAGQVFTEHLSADFAMTDRVLCGQGAQPRDMLALKAGFPALAPWCQPGAGGQQQQQQQQQPDPLWARRVAALLPPPELAAELVGVPDRVCSNTACTRLEGDSAAGVVLQRCSGRCGGAVAYCCVECQACHWADGHKAVCGKRAAAGR
ncbi:hypothetical protein HXX76_004773 [Chlamydomonas incerta]|uniref:MYND-type domain-containing protein n=1 Tax=Chlamydomonas incerta TaxID=51695 RepID=A0A835TJ80_CHLIN|nr:hypothetical protein HXX76_004773 [Chlamydomonas incerta]|eukprot:KAG2439416.1 hypothetical protein HXX76_004773 [Chlamydomonas incerta]